MLKKFGCLSGTDEQWGRRDFVNVGSLGFLGMNLAESLRIQAATPPRRSSNAKAKACILVWLEGGPAQMDTFDPKPSSSFRPISTNVAGIQVSELFPKLAKRMVPSRFPVIRGAGEWACFPMWRNWVCRKECAL